MRNSKRIMRVKKCKDQLCSCNVCLKSTSDQTLQWPMHEIQFGYNNSTTSITICSMCLNDFSDLLWKYMMTEEEQEIDESSKEH